MVDLHSHSFEILRVCRSITRRNFWILTTIASTSLAGCGWIASSTQSETYIGITISANNHSPLNIERRIAFPVETELRQIHSVQRINVHIVKGLACFQVWFDPDQNLMSARDDVTRVIERIAPSFSDVATQPMIDIVKGETIESFCRLNSDQISEHLEGSKTR